MGEKHNEILTNLIELVNLDTDTILIEELYENLGFIYDDIAFSRAHNNFLISFDGDNFNSFLDTTFSTIASNFIKEINYLISDENSTLSDILSFIQIKELELRGTSLSDFEKSDLRYILSVCKNSAIFWAPENQGGLGNFSKLSNKLYLIKNLRNDYGGLREDPPSKWNLFWKGALKSDTFGAIGATTTIGYGAYVGSAAIIAAEGTAAVLSGAALAIGVVSFVGGLVNTTGGPSGGVGGNGQGGNQGGNGPGYGGSWGGGGGAYAWDHGCRCFVPIKSK